MSVLGMAVRSGRDRLAGAEIPLGLPRRLARSGIGMLAPASLLGAPVPPVPVMPTLPVLAAAPLTVLPMPVRAMGLGMGIRTRRVSRRAHRMRTGRPARIGRRLRRIRVMAVR